MPGVIRLIATDLDGTLLRSDNCVSERTRAALRAADDAGLLIAFVTGRPTRWLDEVVETTGHLGVAVGANGAVLYDLATGTVLNIYLDFVSGPTVFNATIARSGPTFTVTIGSLVSGAVTSTAKGKNTMVWQPSSQATNLSTGIAVWPTTVNESGGNDNDF